MKIKGSDDKPITKKDDLITYIESITNTTLTAEQESMIPENCSDFNICKYCIAINFYFFTEQINKTETIFFIFFLRFQLNIIW